MVKPQEYNPAVASEHPLPCSTEEQRVAWHSSLQSREGDAVDLDLLDKSRTLLHSGDLWQKTSSRFRSILWTKLHVWLFDNYLVLSIEKGTADAPSHSISCKPIFLDLLKVVSSAEPAAERSPGVLQSILGRGQTTILHPFAISHSGGFVTLYAESVKLCEEWRYKLQEALRLRQIKQDAHKTFELRSLSNNTFSFPTFPSSQKAQFPGPGATGKVTCSIVFKAADGRQIIAIGCEEGVWLGLRKEPRTLCHVLHLKLVIQCAVLQEHGILLVLASNSVLAYSLETLVSAFTSRSQPTTLEPQKLSGGQHVLFLSVGVIGSQTLVIYAKNEGMDTTFRVLEPIVVPGENSSSKYGRSDWFRTSREFFIEDKCHNLVFLKDRVLVMRSQVFETMDLKDFTSVYIPDRSFFAQHKFGERLKQCRPLNMFRVPATKPSTDEFMLCYNRFGVWCDEHGNVSRPDTIVQWEGIAERVVFYGAHVLLFNPDFIEIRHVGTGKLVQIIPGAGVQCIWDGYSMKGKDEPALEADVHLHVVINSSAGEDQQGQVSIQGQEVLALVPIQRAS